MLAGRFGLLVFGRGARHPALRADEVGPIFVIWDARLGAGTGAGAASGRRCRSSVSRPQAGDRGALCASALLL